MSEVATQSGIDLAGVSKVFAGNVTAVDDVSLEIQSGEFMVLVGPSGCGKTTLMRMIAGLESVTAGSIHIGERDVTYLPPRDRGNSSMTTKRSGRYSDETPRERRKVTSSSNSSVDPAVSSM